MSRKRNRSGGGTSYESSLVHLLGSDLSTSGEQASVSGQTMYFNVVRHPRKEPRGCALDSAAFINTWPNVPSYDTGQNSFVFTSSMPAGNILVEIPTGNYTALELATLIDAGILSASGGTTVTLTTIGDDGHMTITAGNSTGLISTITWTQRMAGLTGFSTLLNTFGGFPGAALRSQSPTDMSPVKTIIVQSHALGGNETGYFASTAFNSSSNRVSNAIATIPLTAAYGSIQTYKRDDDGRIPSVRFHSEFRGMNPIDIYLTDQDGVPLHLHHQETLSYMLKLYY